MIYLVSYDLSPRQPPNGGRRVFGPRETVMYPFHQELERSPSWWHYIDKTWLVCTDETLEQLSQRLCQHLGPTDMLLITEFRGEYSGFLPPEAWNWIEEKMSATELVT